MRARIAVKYLRNYGIAGKRPRAAADEARTLLVQTVSAGHFGGLGSKPRDFFRKDCASRIETLVGTVPTYEIQSGSNAPAPMRKDFGVSFSLNVSFMGAARCEFAGTRSVRALSGWTKGAYDALAAVAAAATGGRGALERPASARSRAWEAAGTRLFSSHTR
jgi:hypothetical protein